MDEALERMLFLAEDLLQDMAEFHFGEIKMTSSPTFVCTFEDGTTTRMTTHCTAEKLDLGRGIRLAQAAYESRMKQPAPALMAGHFEAAPNGNAGKILKTYTAKELNKATTPATKED